MHRKQVPGGCWVMLLVFFAFPLSLGSAVALLSNTNLLLHGVRTQGTVVAVGSSRCEKGRRQSVSVRFIAQSGQTYTSTATRCEVFFLSPAVPGDSVPIVYLPEDPTTTALADDLRQPLIGTLLFPVLFGLLLLILGISKFMRKPSLPP